MTRLCPLCQREVTVAEVEAHATLPQVTGYVERRQDGGANAIRLRTVTGRHAHRDCVDRERRHVNAGQGALNV